MTLYDQGQGVGAGLQGSPPSGVAGLNLPCLDSPAFLGEGLRGTPTLRPGRVGEAAVPSLSVGCWARSFWEHHLP